MNLVYGTRTAYSHKPGTNRLNGITTAGTTTTVTSTPTGNLATMKTGGVTTETLLYNQANQLASAQTTSTFASYAYDLTGQRLEKSQPGVNPILYQFNRTGGELLSENDLHSGTTADYIYLDPGRNSQPIGEVNPTTGKLYFTHTDKLGTPQVLTDSTQAVAWSATYQPFGSTVQFNGPLATQSLRLPGQQFDAETGYNHNGFRNYAGTLTRFVESDPVGLNGGMNTFQYAKGNAFKFTDRRGLDIIDTLGPTIVKETFSYGASTAIGDTPGISPYLFDYLIGGALAVGAAAAIDPALLLIPGCASGAFAEGGTAAVAASALKNDLLAAAPLIYQTLQQAFVNYLNGVVNDFNTRPVYIQPGAVPSIPRPRS